MRPLGDTITRLRTGRHHPGTTTGHAAGRLVAMPMGATNPGNLKAWSYVPAGCTNMPLVVVLHGCTQTATGYDLGSGWSALAERHGFAVLFPEQQRANNPNLCFNWFSPSDARRGSGELLSIREMVAAMVDAYAVDPARIFVSGLSAGGAMTSALLASYPEVFAGGAIIAGLPFGAADTMSQAFDRMRGHGHVKPERYADHVRNASDHRGPWPMVSVWHGSVDATVASNNADAILGQWQVLNDVAVTPDEEGRVDGAVHRLWHDRTGRVCLEDFRIAGMGHGTPLATSGNTAAGAPGPYMLDVGISSTWHSAVRWGLIDPQETAMISEVEVDIARKPSMPDATRSQSISLASGSIQNTIETALRSAGLMR